jgi:hypothetical protein
MMDTGGFVFLIAWLIFLALLLFLGYLIMRRSGG